MGSFSKQQLKKSLEAKQLAIQKIDAEMLNEALTNPLLENYGKLDDYYKTWIKDSKLVAVIPALPKDHPKSQSYYASGEYSAVFMYENEPYTDNAQNNIQKRFFLFDSEYSKLFSYEKKPHSQEYHTVKKPGFDEKIKEFEAKPVVLFFLGCDDGHVGKRFNTQQDAMEYLQLLDVFEDIFEDELEHHN